MKKTPSTYDTLVLGEALPGFHEIVVTRYPNWSAYLWVLSDRLF